jgi:predicted nucleic-acid-binding protein
MSYLASEYLNGFSAKAIKTYVPPLVLLAVARVLTLNPLERKSDFVSVALMSSALAKFGYKVESSGLSISLEESKMFQLEVASVLLYKINLGLNPMNTKGPSVEPLPV